MLVSAIIVNYNTFVHTCNCIESIIKYTKDIPYEIIVVDNASPGDDPDRFKELFPAIKLIKSTENGGFAKGNNLGIQHAAGNIILLINSDAYLTEDSISITARLLMQYPHVGGISCRLNYEDGNYQKNARKFRSIRNELLDIARPLIYLLPYKKRARLMLNQYFRGDFDTPCDWVSGAFMMFRKEILQKLPDGRLDERFFMYGEDQLWAYQFKEHGYTSYFTAATSVVHIANVSTDKSKQLKLEKTMLLRELEIMIYRKNHSFYYYLFRLIYTAKEKTRYIIKSLAGRKFRNRLR